MAYNIDTQKVKVLENFTLPVSALYKSERKDWHPQKPQIIDFETNEVEIKMGCGQTIKGILKDGIINVSSMQLSGEGSGGLFSYVLNDAFKESKGKFEAVFVWEGGDSITSFKVNDGEISDTNVEL